jgi:hypothetical protein
MNCKVFLLNYLFQSILYLLNWTQVWRKRWPPYQVNSICRKLLFGTLSYMPRSTILLKLESWMWLKIFVKWKNNFFKIKKPIDFSPILFPEYI